MSASVLLVTTNEIPGYTISEILGTVFGVSVRSRTAIGNALGNVSQAFGGEQKGYAKLVRDTRDAALADLVQNAAAMGANAVLAVRFDSNQVGNEKNAALEEVIAYGTAVVLG
jgi:uncharacterized protein YbjQ (UPF0145 family)